MDDNDTHNQPENKDSLEIVNTINNILYYESGIPWKNGT